MVKIEVQIENLTPPQAIGTANLFYRNFFCEFLNMTLKIYNKLPIKVHDVMFQYKDMINAIKIKSPKYFSKLAQLNYLARKVLYYYLKEINENDDNVRLQFKLCHHDDINELSYYNHYNKIFKYCFFIFI